MEIGLNQGCIVFSSDMEKDLRLAEDAGFDCLEIRTDRAREYFKTHAPAQLRDAFQAHHLKPGPIGGTYLYREFLSEWDDPERQARLLSDIHFAFQVGQTVGSDTIIAVPPMNPEAEGEIPYAHDFEDTMRILPPMLRKLSDIAREYNMKLALELVGAARCSVRTVEQGRQVLQATDRDNIGLTIDAYNLFLYDRSNDFSAIASIPAEQIFVVHINDAEDLPLERMRQANRTYCGRGVMDLDAFLQNLKRAGYAGMVSIEFFEKPDNSLPPEQIVKECYRTTREVMQRNGVL